MKQCGDVGLSFERERYILRPLVQYISHFSSGGKF